jgi:hypothetical protein
VSDVVTPGTGPREPAHTARLRARVAGVPDPVVVDDLAAGIADSVRYLGSDAALRSLAADLYWPKWDSPWWHMLALHELGEARQIPPRAVAKMVEQLDALPLKFFPLRPEDARGVDPMRFGTCHCALGTMYQVLTACGVDVDAALPWLVPWFVRYQMADGGLNCDETAYLVTHECASSMVGTVAAFEAMLLGASTPAQQAFVDRAAGFLIGRRLVQGSATQHNAEERAAAAGWLAPCFPRVYFYDALRGLSALVRWAERGGRAIPVGAVAPVVEHLVAAFPDGVIRLQREGFASCPTSRTWTADGVPGREPTTRFPLLDQASAIGRACATSTRQWAEARRALLGLIDAGRIVADA